MRRKTLLLGLLVAIPLLTGCERTTAHWKMDETSGSVMADSAGQHEGTLHNVAFDTGRTGGAYRFNGVTSYVQVPDAADLEPGAGGFSYKAWIKTTVLPPVTSPDIVRKGVSTTAGGDYKMELFPVNGSARVRCVMRGSEGTATAGGGNNLQDGRWHLIACSRKGDTLTLAIDGTTVKSMTTPIGTVNNAAPVMIGAKTPDQDHYNGLIDDLTIGVG
jgi:hypothetical protein